MRAIEAVGEKIGASYRHAAVRIKGEVSKAKAAIESAHIIVERMRDDTKATDFASIARRRGEREIHQRSGNTAPLMVQINSKLAEQERRKRIGAITLRRFRQIRPLDLCRRKADIAHNRAVYRITYDADPRGSRLMISPAMPPEPFVQRNPSAIEILDLRWDLR